MLRNSLRHAPWLALALFGLVGGACQEIESNPYPCDAFCPEEVEDTGVADTDEDIDDDTSEDVGPTGDPWAGIPCAVDADCGGSGRMCLNAETLSTFGLELEIQNGFCSRLACNSDLQCGPGGYCFNTQPFSGTNISLCFASCAEMNECRWQEGYGCYALSNLETDPEAEPTDDAVCLPQSITVLIECNDGHCDVNTDGDVDADGNDIWDYRDNCPFIENGDQADSDRDGLGDACDPVDDNAAEE